MRRWLAVLLLMLGGLGTEADQPGPCQLIANSRTGRYPNDGDDRYGRYGRHDRNTGDDPKAERRRRVF